MPEFVDFYADEVSSAKHHIMQIGVGGIGRAPFATYKMLVNFGAGVNEAVPVGTESFCGYQKGIINVAGRLLFVPEFCKIGQAQFMDITQNHTGLVFFRDQKTPLGGQF